MSNFIYGRIVVNSTVNSLKTNIDFEIIEYCAKNGFAVHFIETLPTKNTCKDINFCISDNFFVKYCNDFMQPIIYTLSGEPLTKNINDDISKLHGMIQIILGFEFVNCVELRFSYVEVDEDEYEVCVTSVANMHDLIIKKFLSNMDFPVIKVIIKREI